ncbi:MAG: FMN-binding protein [Oscillospiraceae bacterium]|nr:FMN-binding protein [Oscillospiraceae bacterium]
MYSIRKGNSIQKLLCISLVPALALSLFSFSGKAVNGNPARWNDGTYQGTGRGYKSEITLSVSVENGVIAEITEVSQNETPERWASAKTVFSAMVAENSYDVDAVSGATYSCEGIRSAVADALAKASDTPAGTGTEQDPYLIYNAAQLRTFGAWVDEGTHAAASSRAVLRDNIDLSGTEWNPIGAEGKASENTGRLFSGTFSGGGHTIEGLRIRGTYRQEANLGLFSTLGAEARIFDLHLKNVYIEAGLADETAGSVTNLRAGGIAGDTVGVADGRGAVVDGCTADGSIRVSSGAGRSFAGGILGRSFTGTATVNCVSAANVTAVSEGVYNAACAGGIAGMCGFHTLVANCASFGSVQAENPTGGADAYAGGLAGILGGSAYLCYSSSDVTILQRGGTAKRFVGALAGQLSGAPAGAGNYYLPAAKLTVLDEERSGEPVSARPWSSDDMSGNVGAEPVESGEALQTAAFAGFLNGLLQDAYNALSEPEPALREWVLEEGRVLPAGAVWTPGEIDGTLFASGNGTAEDPWMIDTEARLRAFAASLNERIDYRGTYLRLGADIDLSGEAWTPIGGSYARFDGCFDGAGHKISHLTMGSAEAPMTLEADNSCVGLFGWLNRHAVIENVTLEDVSIHTRSSGSVYIGAVAGRMSGADTEGDYRGAVIDGCTVSGTLSHTTAKGTFFLGGVCGHMFKGAVINTQAGVVLNGTEQSGELAEVGGIAGLVNRGLIANCSVSGAITGSGYRETERDIEGMACVGGIAGVNGGAIANCCALADVEAMEYSIDTGLVAGWVTGIAKAYGCVYRGGASMRIDGRDVVPPDPFGELVPGGVSDEYFFRFPGSLTEGNLPFDPTPAGAASAADALNAAFQRFPIDIAGSYGLSDTSLRLWDAGEDRPTLGSGYAVVAYVQPEIEQHAPETEEEPLTDGVWYGRSQDRESVVAVTVSGGVVVETQAVSGSGSGEAFDEAVGRAKIKARYGDGSGYAPADLTMFPKGSGTAFDPYRVETKEQLQYLSASINEDVDWNGVCFLQTADISLAGLDWKPIGWGIFADGDGDGFGQDIVALYPFRGSYDGGGHAISGLTAGSAQAPAGGNWMGLFGVIQGGYSGNEIPADGGRAELKNIRLENVRIYTENRWRSIAGGLVGSAQGGFVIDNCAVSGTVSASSAEDFAYGGGLAGSLMYGCVSDCRTDVEVYARAALNYSYAGGMSAVTNRATLVNSFALGDVHGASALTNRAEAGGFTGLDGGICINCYACGNVEALEKYSMYLGGFSGMAASSSEHRQCYFNRDAAQTVAGEPVAEKRYAGKFVNESRESAEQAQAAGAMASEAFCSLLERNRLGIRGTLSEVREALGADERGSSAYHSVYYGGDGADLNAWAVSESGPAGFAQRSAGGEACALNYIVRTAQGAAVSVTNRGGDPEALVVAVYREDGSMLCCKSVTLSGLSSPVTVEIAAGLEPALVNDAGNTVAAFLLDGQGRPLCREARTAAA